MAKKFNVMIGIRKIIGQLMIRVVYILLVDIVIAKLPNDGSLTGTYGSYTYAAQT